MKGNNNLYVIVVVILITLSCCTEKKSSTKVKDKLPSFDHDLSYIPYDTQQDNPTYIICDSTNFHSGRNRVQYIGGNKKLKEDITLRYNFRSQYESFNGYIVVLFLVNCNGQRGRFRTQSLNLDFTPSKSPDDLENYVKGIIKTLDNWKWSTYHENGMEYSKFVNLKFRNGQIEYVIL